jgi:phosphoglucomutase
LSILAHTKKSVEEVVRDHWARFGRSYYQRHDFEGLDSDAANKMIAALRDKIPTLTGSNFAGDKIGSADDFSYTDPVDGSTTTKQGVRLLLTDGSRAVFRLSGTGTSGATLRLYIERYRNDQGSGNVDEILAPLLQAARELVQLQEFTGRDKANVIT